MEKVVLSKGYEFELVTNGIRDGKDFAKFTFIPGDYTVEQLMQIWAGNSDIRVKLDEVSVRVFNNLTKCDQMTRVSNYLISTKFVCPNCGTEVEPTATNCPNCNAAFGPSEEELPEGTEREENSWFPAPNMEEVRGVVCVVEVKIPDINDRMTDAEDAIEDIVSTILG